MTHQCEECGAPVAEKWAPCADCRGKRPQASATNATPSHGQSAADLRRLDGRVVETCASRQPRLSASTNSR